MNVINIYNALQIEYQKYFRIAECKCKKLARLVEKGEKEVLRRIGRNVSS
jgi:hypothetical protein